MKFHIIVSGIPASGKSTVGRAIATALRLAMLDKDDFLEAFFNSQDIGDAEWRTHLSRRADEALREKALCSDGAVITSWWRHPSSGIDSGTPVEWLSSLAGIKIEVHCVCSPEVAAKRFLSRKRHARCISVCGGWATSTGGASVCVMNCWSLIQSARF